MEAASSSIRSALTASPGKKLVASDLSNIEGRMLAWLAGEEKKLQAFRDFDAGKGHDLYKITAGGILGKAPEDVTKDERQSSGKVPELACLGPNTLVLTDNGTKPIVLVSKDDKVWDGQQWVAHAGVVAKGERPTLVLDGVEMTPDHLVLCGGSWTEAQTVASKDGFLNQALVTGSESLRLLARSAAPLEGCVLSPSGAPADTSAPRTSATFDAERRPGATPAPRSEAVRAERSGSGTPMSCLMTRTEGACATASRPALTGVTTQTTPGIETTAAEGYGFTNRGERTERRSWRTSSRLMGGMCQLWSWIAQTSTRAMSPETCASSRSARTRKTRGRSKASSAVSPSLRPVFDIAHAGPLNRFTILTDNGALVVHNCGFQGAVGAFQSMARLYGLEMSDARALEIVKGWRKNNPNIVSLWYDLEEAAVLAVSSPGRRFECRRLVLQRDGSWLRIRLPSGRYLCYPGVRVEDGKLTYMGTNQYSRRWERIPTYGGKLAENATQAGARDVIAHQMPEVEAAGFEIVLTVHDEIVCEAPLDNPSLTSHYLSSLMSAVPPWAQGLPLAAEGYEARRYRK